MWSLTLASEGTFKVHWFCHKNRGAGKSTKTSCRVWFSAMPFQNQYNHVVLLWWLDTCTFKPSNLLGPHPWLTRCFLCHVCSVTFKLCFLPRFTAFESWASRIRQPQTAHAQRQPLIYQSKAKALELLSDQPSHSPPLLLLLSLLSFCYPRWQGVSLHVSELLKLGQMMPLGISWSRPRRRSSPRGEVRMSHT